MGNIQLATNLRYLRELNKKKQKDMSELFNISRQAISNYETMNRTPDLDLLISIASHHDLTLDQLVLHNLANLSATSQETMPQIKTVHEPSGHSLYLTDEELELLMDFRSLSDADRSIIKGFITSKK